jgi:hypothetical protein
MMEPPLGVSPQGTFLAITAPAAGQVFVREQVSPDAQVVAMVALRAQASEDVAVVEWRSEDDRVMAAVGAPYESAQPFIGDGMRRVVAVARAADGAELARTDVTFTVQAGKISCRQILESVGIKYTVGPANKGVADPVTVTPPLGGIDYFSYGSATRRQTFFMDCTLAVALHKLGRALKPKGVVAIEDIGVYNYRCIGGGNPDTDSCEPSQHAYAKGIDIHELRGSDGATYNVETDFVIDPDSEKTCSAATSNAKDKFLHESACLMKSLDIFNIILTPNYNAAHRNHFHVDLTTGSNYINAASPDAFGVDPPLALDDH